MDALRTGLYTLFTASSDLYAALSGRLFFGAAPDGVNLSDGPYGVFFFVSDVDDDPLSEIMREVYVQFSFFSGASSPAEIFDLDSHLTALYKDKTFSVTGWTVINMFRVQANGPNNVPADTEAGTGRYWQLDVDYSVTLKG